MSSLASRIRNKARAAYKTLSDQETANNSADTQRLLPARGESGYSTFALSSTAPTRSDGPEANRKYWPASIFVPFPPHNNFSEEAARTDFMDRILERTWDKNWKYSTTSAMDLSGASESAARRESGAITSVGISVDKSGGSGFRAFAVRTHSASEGSGAPRLWLDLNDKGDPQWVMMDEFIVFDTSAKGIDASESTIVDINPDTDCLQEHYDQYMPAGKSGKSLEEQLRSDKGFHMDYAQDSRYMFRSGEVKRDCHITKWNETENKKDRCYVKGVPTMITLCLHLEQEQAMRLDKMARR